ncbi:hypothetical protein [Xanthomonas sp. XNM01]|uniref:hypothetical protein n=1 Tax=Xanthomonas sp. XNM01 TaxID=2769289 RepID=UPI001780471E|nr:hypothetical protein [Xanthomonas sp. XNM01]MBD9367188.1 hypothetical protein [Xanthomonas sp. XNM01]
MLVSLLFIAAFGVDAKVQAGGSTFSPEKGLSVSGAFDAQRRAILDALSDGKTYSEISSDSRSKVRVALDRMASVIGDVDSLDELTEVARLNVLNDQELVNALLTQAREDSRLVCIREKQVGSHRSVNKCATVAQRRQMATDTQQKLQSMQRFKPAEGP